MTDMRTQDDFTDELVDHATVVELAATTLCKIGMPDEHARWMAEWLVESDMNGVRTHGLRLLPQYVERARHAAINVRPSIRITSSRSAVITVDGDNGFGQVVATATMNDMIERARQTGTVSGTVRNSNHLGALAPLARMATTARLFVFAAQNTTNNTVPWGGTRPAIGNNPVAWGLPVDNAAAIVLDMACSETARGRLKLAKDRGESIDIGWAVGPDGRPTTDPAAALQGGLMPFGGHKGSGIAVFSGALSGVLSGANFGSQLPKSDDYTGARSMGHFFYVADIEAFLPWDEYVSRMTEYVTEIRESSSPVDDRSPITLPGERSADNRSRAGREGVPVERRLLRFMNV